jgi:hypothetical protein
MEIDARVMFWALMSEARKRRGARQRPFDHLIIMSDCLGFAASSQPAPPCGQM